LYGLVDNLDWLNTLLELGVDTLQWRVKSPQLYEQQYGDGRYARDMKIAIELCKQNNISLYINDDWAMAIELGAYGVHLGQEDMVAANLSAISKAGLALGVSTHTEWEIARARAFKPSYIAFGPVHPPLSKKLKYPPLGYNNLSNWCARVGQEFPLTCIGGITTDNIANIKKCGMPSAAIVTDLMMDDGLQQRHARLRNVY
jgi:hydroxymethylpyrimidine kinase/phosphomethylpyrimidine kinase/thiamine-phosphate diphosphorylase